MKQKQLYQALKKYFNYNTFQTGQLEIMEEVVAGNDVLGVLSTGSGKSLCYQLPAKLLPGVTIVVSPLISLMIDQVRQVKSFHYKEVVAFHSFQSYSERKRLMDQLATYKLIYISPELLQQKNMFEKLKQLQISLFVVDEAHCISQWGHDFRPDYLRLKEVIHTLGQPPILALTGTATPEVQAEITRDLGRPNMKQYIYPMDQANISLLIESVANDTEKLTRIVDLLTTYQVPTIIYFLSRKTSENVAAMLQEKLPTKNIAFYHGGVANDDRLKIQQQFMNDQLQIICSTSAFGMGINKANIRLVIHYHVPPQLEAYIQEIGRAGRDGKPSVSLLLHDASDMQLPLYIVENELPTENEIRTVFNQLYYMSVTKAVLPSNEVEISEMMQITTSKWRFMYYHLEKAGIIVDNQIHFVMDHWQVTLQQLMHVAARRLTLKYEKVAEISTWIESNSCLRKALYDQFQHKTTSKTTQCCSHCGFDFDSWDVEEDMLHRPTPVDWRKQLQEILLIGDNR